MEKNIIFVTKKNFFFNKLSLLLEKDGFILKKVSDLNEISVKSSKKTSLFFFLELKDVISELKKLKIEGLMCIPPFDQDPSLYFNLLKNLCDQNNLKHASMGMTNDFKKAIQFGATYIRVGSGIFGERS